MKAFFLLLALCFLCQPAPAAAAPAISCHCFQDRSYDAARPAAADPYLLATTQNSLLAAVFGLDKKKVVREKMTGTSGDTLWVAHYLADRCGQPAPGLMAAFDRSGGSWMTAADGCGRELGGNRFSTLLAANAPGEVLAAAVVNEIVAARLGAEPGAVEQIRVRKGSNAELIFAVYLARKGDRSPVEIYADIAGGRATWGQMLEKMGGTAASIEQDIRRLAQDGR